MYIRVADSWSTIILYYRVSDIHFPRGSLYTACYEKAVTDLIMTTGSAGGLF